jgi:hypothetical protein
MKKLNYMRRTMVAGMLFLLPYVLSAQVMRIGRGASVVMQGNARLVLNDASLVNDGSLSGNSTVIFTGESLKDNATIGGVGKTAFDNLLISRPLLLDKDISVNGVLTMSSGDLELNNHRLHLGSTGMIMGEHISSRVTGAKGGSVIATAMLNAPVRVNPGNIGVELGSSSNLGHTVITRGHVQQVNARGESGIQRYFDIQPAFNGGDVTLRFFYLEPELEGAKESDLVLWSSENAITGWSAVGKESGDAGTNWIVKSNIGKLSRFTLGVADKSAFVKRSGLAGISGVQAYPNPARDRFTVAFYSDTDKEGSVSLQDALGRVLERRRVQYIKGMNTMRWDVAKYAAGSYYVVFENAGMGNLKIVKE